MSSHYAASAAQPDYSHRFHAGNVGDVWKHFAWWTLTAALQRLHPALAVLDCHAGNGSYLLQTTGEWTAGIGRLLEAVPSELDGPLGEYIRFILSYGERNGQLVRYPGSPLLLAGLMRPTDSAAFCEKNPEFAAELQRTAVGERLAVVAGDGLAALAAPAPPGAPQLCLIDPPWNVKSDWQTIPAAVIAAARAEPARCIGIWYPIKSYTRVAAMIKTLVAAELPLLAADLITTPLDLRRNRLNGSGICIVNPPPDIAPVLAHGGAVIGRAAATHRGFYELRCAAFGS